jgi:ABC-type multidrug transport system fused ATPase/permease subunit
MFWRIIEYTKHYWKTILAITVMIMVMAVLRQTEPFVTKLVADTLIGENLSEKFSFIVLLLTILLAAKLVQAILNRISWAMTNIFVIKFETHLKKIGFDHLMRLSLSFFNDQTTGKIMSKLDRGVNRIVNIVNNSGMHFIPSVVTALLSLSIVMYYEWRIGLITLLAFIPYVFINQWSFKKNNILERREHKFYDHQYSHFWEVLNSMSLIKAFRAERFERNKLTKFFKKYINIRKEMESNTNKAFAGDIILETMIWAMYAFIVYIAWQGQISVGTLILLAGLIKLIREPLWELNWIFWEVKRAQVGARDFFRIIDAKIQVLDPEKPQSLNKLKGQIEFKDVSFTYKNKMKNHFKKNQEELDKTAKKSKPIKKNIQVLNKVNFIIKPGQMTAFVGPSGAGKTTIASLVMRFFDPEEGDIILDGINLKDLKQEELRSYMGLVSQDSHLFATTIKENLKYAKPTASETEMWDALKVAHANDFVKKLPEGLDTQIGDRGVKLSGGQRQRLSLARTILRNPEIIILDEATSSLDSESEMYIQQALKKLLKGKTSIVIAHRLSTIQRADNIIVFKNQKILEQGNHNDLLKQDGLYASLFKIQSGDKEKLKEWDLVE